MMEKIIIVFRSIVLVSCVFLISMTLKMEKENKEIKNQLKSSQDKEFFSKSIEADSIEVLTSICYLIDNMKNNGFIIDKNIHLNNITVIPSSDEQYLKIKNEFEKYFSCKYKNFSNLEESNLICNINIIFTKINSNEKNNIPRIEDNSVSQCSLMLEKNSNYSEMFLITISINIYDKNTKETKYDDFSTSVVSRSYLKKGIKTF